MKVAFLGLGVMGFPMAGYLAKAGHQVVVYNRSVEKAQRWLESYPGVAQPTPAAAVAEADFVFACVGNDNDIRSVCLGEEGAFAAMKPGSVFVDHTTASADVARELGEAANALGLAFIDAPVSGGQAGAENGKLTVMCGGDQSVFDRAVPLINHFAQSVKLMGPVGSGQLTKMVNQICIAGVVQGLSEGLHFAQKAGLDAAAVIEVISKGAAQSWQMENRYQTMLAGEYEHGFAVDWMRKDLAIVLAEADQQGASVPITALVDQFYGDVQRAGGGRWDTSSLLARLQHIDNIEY
ncbi:NAD(P)-dependent oxidoreductase [Umboniibacter marinipuniceus]|uniref:3-hydroxyisobutyrate dehydrogenase/2-hydroxy-3-oxopropionate reductase n=1 Tax=Umboniibacter marinipuniceus TaxID=569599 RepID=A0A3M0A384_9GAMM|nr:NAD(P)-dependent oxidoreductase [Umboniibacter marinipuniceus]RMA79290.1 3-hydroxyisobutyrate dehydrogenase/2-hydroxy-3-oxopropionate reductase [Umboniibacter marinipuniceus]